MQRLLPPTPTPTSTPTFTPTPTPTFTPTPHASPQERLRECYLRSGVNHIEDCKEFRETLWKKMNTYNYGAPGPERGTARFR